MNRTVYLTFATGDLHIAFIEISSFGQFICEMKCLSVNVFIGVNDKCLMRAPLQGLALRRLERVFCNLLQCLWNDGRLQRRMFNDVGKLHVSLQLYCWAILWRYLWHYISYHGNAQGPQKRPLNFSFCKLSEKIIRWPTIFIPLLESSLNSLTFQTVWKQVI